MSNALPPDSTQRAYSDIFAEVARLDDEAGAYPDAIRILVLRNITVEGLDTYVKHYLFPRRIRPEIVFGGYGTMMQDVLADDGLLSTFDPDVVVLALALEELDPSYGAPGWRSETAQTTVLQLLDLLAKKSRATVAVHTIPAPLVPELGLVLDPFGNDLTSQVGQMNDALTDFVRRHAPRFFLVDWDRLLRRLGEEAALDRRGYYLWKSPYKRRFLEAWARQLSHAALALKGRTKKCLVLDCDNTLWGGIIGEDGLEGIQLDGNHYPGKAFLDFQISVLHLAERGVLIALCSKNNEADVFEVLDRHAWCRLKRSHLSAWRINWQDKAANIADLATELNLGLDAFVFVDDNPVECNLVSQMLPQVTVVQVPKKLHELPPILLDSGLFDTLRLTDEDRQRARLYQSESQRKSALDGFGTVDDYLASLSTVAVIHRAQAAEIPRIAQLTQKTNQFNLTTRRYSEQEIQALADSPDVDVYSLSARDRFGSLGLVGVLIVRHHEAIADIDTFLMSCRALGRKLEEAMIGHCLREISSARGVATWQGRYLPTAKNAQVAEFWPRFGFALTQTLADQRIYQRDGRAALSLSATHVSIQEE